MAQRLTLLAEISLETRSQSAGCFLSSKHQDYLAAVAEYISAKRA